tara:strand:+ start:1045 stop:1173 length:129 start_codon:yes stop_codon:yes gene_type:complete
MTSMHKKRAIERDKHNKKMAEENKTEEGTSEETESGTEESNE